MRRPIIANAKQESGRTDKYLEFCRRGFSLLSSSAAFHFFLQVRLALDMHLKFCFILYILLLCRIIPCFIALLIHTPHLLTL